jgi:tetratricopeptide (TPR) repeat protein
LSAAASTDTNKYLLLAEATQTTKVEHAKPHKKQPDHEDDQEKNISKSPPGETKPYADEAVKHFNRGVELHQAGFFNQAIGEYKAAIAADDRMQEAYSNLGLIYLEQHNYPRAKEAFLQALKLSSNRPSTLNGLGSVYYVQGQISQAMDKWKEALKIDPKFASAYYNMGNAYEVEKNQPEAKACYMKALAVMPTMADAYFRLGNILNKEHRYAQAEVLLKKSIELAPDGEFVREARHSLAAIESRFEKTKAKNQPLRKNKNSERT